MSRQINSRVQQAPQGGSGGGGGGLLRSLLRPFMPEVAAGIDMADGAITALSGGGGGGLQGSLAQASKMLSGGEGATEYPGKKMSEGGVDPGKVPEVNPVMASAETQDMGAEEGEELTDEQMAAFQQLDQQFPGVNQQFAADPSLLDGASNMVNKLRYMYRKQAGGGVVA